MDVSDLFPLAGNKFLYCSRLFWVNAHPCAGLAQFFHNVGNIGIKFGGCHARLDVYVMPLAPIT